MGSTLAAEDETPSHVLPTERRIVPHLYLNLKLITCPFSFHYGRTCSI